MTKNLAPKILFAVLLTFTLNSLVYFSFGNIYSHSILSYESFGAQFGFGVYSLRVLSAVLLVGVYEFLGTLQLDYTFLKLKLSDSGVEPQMLVAFYILNTFFAVLCGVLLIFITNLKSFVASNTEKILITTAGIFAISISQFVIVPYDCSSYFFLLFFILVFLKYCESQKKHFLVVAGLLIFVATLNRETAALSLSFAATMLYQLYGLKKKTLSILVFLGGIFVATYFGLRVLSGSFSTNDGSLLTENFTKLKNYFGMLFWLVFFSFSLLIATGKDTRRSILLFHLFSAPYILMCFYTGILYEVRLYVPLFLSALVLGRISMAQQNKVVL